MSGRRYCWKCIITDIFLLHFKEYLHSFIQSAVFTGRVAHQTIHLYVLRMIVKLAYLIGISLFFKQSIQKLKGSF